MAKFGIDFTKFGVVPDGVYPARIVKLIYQIKIGAKWNKEGTQVVSDAETLMNYPIPVEQKRFKVQFDLIGTEHLPQFRDYYLMPSALGFLKELLDAAHVQYDENGFDPDDLLNAEVNVTITNSEDPQFGNRSEISKVSAA
jgi:hypothetical protein